MAGTSGQTNTECPAGLAGPTLIRVPTPQGKSYCIDQTEVTQGQYQQFLLDKKDDLSGQEGICQNNQYKIPVGDDTGVCPVSDWTPDKTPKRAVVCVDPCDALAYCKWAGKRLCGDVKGGAIPLDKEGIESGDESKQAPLNDTATSQFYNACSQGGKTTYPYGPQKKEGVCPFKAVDQDVETSTCRGSEPPFNQIINLGGGVAEWEWTNPTLIWGSFVARGGIYGGDSSWKNDRCDAPSFLSMGDYAGFRCCLDLD